MITKRQKEILNFIKSYKERENQAPSLEEIKKYLNLSAVSTVHYHIKKLKDAGLLQKRKNQPRSIVTVKEREMIRVPIKGIIAAGQPIEAVETSGESVSVEKNDYNSRDVYYALRVRGNSMINDGIFNNDLVIIKKQASAENGQTVVAIIDDNEATLKKLYKLDHMFKLEPANQNMLPLYRKEVEVRGVVVNIIRSLELREKLRTLDLFAGIGGIRLGFEKANFKTVFANDFEKQCKATYDANFNVCKLIVEDITRIEPEDLPEFDFLLGGFPCQPFSVAGYREGFKDKKGRGNLFFYIAQIIEKRRPMGFLLENVKNLKSHDHGRTFKIIEKTLKDLGYHIKSKILNSMEYGNVPQNRERIYIVGFKDKKHADNFIFPRKKKLITRVTDLLEKNVDKKYYYNGKPLYEKIKNDVKERGKVYQWRRKYVRENKSGVCPTLTANMGTGGHNVPIIKDRKGIRKLTPLECARLQGFPMDYKLPNLADSTLYKQLGNSVTVTVVEAVAREIKKVVED
ncbi:MAG: transcriptional repressor LexA [Patescibacteria group bacterium]|nr:transcriptional repressor LexA [Patescibacteria group bacterium]